MEAWRGEHGGCGKRRRRRRAPLGRVQVESRGGGERSGESERGPGGCVALGDNSRAPGRPTGRQEVATGGCARRTQLLLLLAEEEDDRSCGGGLGCQRGLARWAAYWAAGKARSVLSLSLIFLFSIIL